MGTTHIFFGMGKLPNKSGIYKKHRILTIYMEIDIETGIITSTNFPEYCELNNSVLASIIKGRSLEYGIEDIINKIEEKLNVSSRKALIVAIEQIYERYLEEKRKFKTII